MQLTPAQLATLKTWLDANASQLDDEAAKNALNAVASPDYYVWNRAVNVVDILDQVTWTNYTPTDVPDNTNTYNNRAFTVQIKQQNLGLLFTGRTTFDASKKTLRAALNDATTNLRTGTAGASVSGGWSNILPTLYRKATVGEKLFAADDGAGVGNNTGDPRGNSTNPDICGAGLNGEILEGQITVANVSEARLL